MLNTDDSINLTDLKGITGMTVKSPNAQRVTVSLKALEKDLYAHELDASYSINNKPTLAIGIAKKLNNVAISDEALMQTDPERYEREKAKIAEIDEEMVSLQTTSRDDRTESLERIDELLILKARLYYNRQDKKYEDGYYKLIDATNLENMNQIVATLADAHIEAYVDQRDKSGGSKVKSFSVVVDMSQPDLDKKISALMDTHREAILAYCEEKNVGAIITKPDGTALDKEQAADVIARHIQALEAERAPIAQQMQALEAGRTALDETAATYGVDRMVDALTRQRTGFGGRGRVEADAASGD